MGDGVTINLYAKISQALGQKKINLSADVLKVMLCNSSYIPTTEHVRKANIFGEVVGANYTAGGVVIKNTKYTTVDNMSTLNGDKIKWEKLSVSNIKYAIIYDSTSDDENLIAYVEFPSAFDIVDSNFELLWSPYGILQIST